MNWELLISGFALLISALAAYYSYRQTRKSNTLQKEQMELQRRVVELEEQREEEKQQAQIKASIKAEVQYRSTAKGQSPYKFRVLNEGPGAAQNVRVFIDGQPVTECDFILADNNSFEVIAAGSEVKFSMAMDYGSPSNWKTLIQWDDKTGTNNKFETILTQ